MARKYAWLVLRTHLVEDSNAMTADRIVRMGIEEVDLFLQFMLAGPVIVALKQCQVLTTAGSDSGNQVLRSAEVMTSEEWYDSIGMTAVEFHKDFARAIRRAIFSDDDFVIKVHLLYQNALEGLRDESLVVIGDQYHAELHTTKCIADIGGVPGSARSVSPPWITCIASPKRYGTGSTIEVQLSCL